MHTWKVLVIGLLACICLALAMATVLIGLDTQGVRVFHAARGLLIGLGALAFAGGFAYAAARNMLHIWLRCPNCNRLVRQDSMDDDGAYYPCAGCGVTWTCPCKPSVD